MYSILQYLDYVVFLLTQLLMHSQRKMLEKGHA